MYSYFNITMNLHFIRVPKYLSNFMCNYRDVLRADFRYNFLWYKLIITEMCQI
jgi:hypothetical protein